MGKVIRMPKKTSKKIDPMRWQDKHRGKCVTLSDKQYSMALALEGRGSRVIDREALDDLMGPQVNSFIARGYLRQHSETSVYWTKEGSQAVKQHGQAHIFRKPSGKFSAFLSLTSFDERPRKKDSEVA